MWTFGAGMLVASVVIACATSGKVVATAEHVSRTELGGLILLSPGSAPQAAVRDALAAMVAHCGRAYEIIEIGKKETERPVPPDQPDQKPLLGNRSFLSGSWSGPPVYGSTLLYLCRRPEDTGLNRDVEAFASQDLLGNHCTSDLDCGFYKCTRSTEPSPTTFCTAADGSIPIPNRVSLRWRA